MGLFKRKAKKEKQKVEQEEIVAEQSNAATPEGTSIKNVKVPA